MSVAHHGGGAALQVREPSTGPSRSRPNSFYEAVDDSDYEYGYGDKMQDQLANAAGYQQTVSSGGLTQALTKDALQKATKRSQGGSSRSTRSSSSHDESEWRNNSATTRTTRSVAGDDDFTIKVTGQATVEVSGTKIQCQDGSAISISSRPPPSQARLSDSDRGSLAYDDRKSLAYDDRKSLAYDDRKSLAYDDRKSRGEQRLPYRNRAMSQSGSGSYTRRQHDGYEQHYRDGDHGHYDDQDY